MRKPDGDDTHIGEGDEGLAQDPPEEKNEQHPQQGCRYFFSNILL